jgi:uncharacterized SAM-binding protein YcdF (DUF218 family)
MQPKSNVSANWFWYEKLIMAVLSLIALSIISWGILFAIFLSFIPDSLADIYTKTDGIVVLTGGKSRITEGLNLLKEGKGEKLLISGIGENANLHELKVLSKEMSPSLVTPLEAKITLGHLATDTKSNATEAAIWMELNNFSSLRLVTSNYHIPRSMLEFKMVIPDKKIIPHPVFSSQVKMEGWWKFPGTTRLVISEFHKFLWVKSLYYKTQLEKAFS